MIINIQLSADRARNNNVTLGRVARTSDSFACLRVERGLSPLKRGTRNA